ncbi:MAG: radical SAM protein [Candidatus Aureabacteria bacterium]|nr:radical SAM protein [Candidatus Auribacterota bacterium]
MNTAHSPLPRCGEKICRTIMSPSGIPGSDYSINPYTGCTHACAYCYARYMQRYSGHREPWGTFVDAKVNAPAVLVREVRRMRPGTSIFISSVTDPYQPVEARYRITRRTLEILAPLPFSVGIHTKSALVEDDLDLLRSFRDISVTFTIVTADERSARCLEPGASPIGERVRVLKLLADAGIATAVFIGPVIPYVTERSLDSLLEGIALAGVREVMLDDLHYAGRLGDRLFPAMRAIDSSLPARLRALPQDYSQQISRIVLEFCRSRHMRCRSFI